MGGATSLACHNCSACTVAPSPYADQHHGIATEVETLHVQGLCVCSHRPPAGKPQALFTLTPFATAMLATVSPALATSATRSADPDQGRPSIQKAAGYNIFPTSGTTDILNKHNVPCKVTCYTDAAPYLETLCEDNHDKQKSEYSLTQANNLINVKRWTCKIGLCWTRIIFELGNASRAAREARDGLKQAYHNDRTIRACSTARAPPRTIYLLALPATKNFFTTYYDPFYPDIHSYGIGCNYLSSLHTLQSIYHSSYARKASKPSLTVSWTRLLFSSWIGGRMTCNLYGGHPPNYGFDLVVYFQTEGRSYVFYASYVAMSSLPTVSALDDTLIQNQ
ncbi:hypothetical protein DFH07DRAFT_785233 [Mycena maculata]|uniref:Uncharacterized protein n=1 Tax=Mycena maculata TaxID=230809 RepID=A0AAD7HBX2_9AGAR|nr:hypothetical protein DFH07DRAFT_785233 [Mycena maculata]